MNPTPASSVTTANILGLVVLAILSILVLPVPGPVMDALLAMSISVSILALLVAVRVNRPLDFSVFPAFLLITTLFRLGLNVATTRLILLHGGGDKDATGAIIRAFGEFAVGGSVLVGAVVFLILLVVNFMVITKGSTRISEVAARFTLDALPGKQMSIDADLAAGSITDKQAQHKRGELAQEAEFFGAMDGASKFVRGDAIAGLIITGINLVGGLIAGVLRDSMDITQAVSTFTVLTVGDGLLSQMPALFISTAAGIVVTKAGTRNDLGGEIKRQVFGNPHVLVSVGVVVIGMGLLPGMPMLAFFVIGGSLLVAAKFAAQARATEAADGNVTAKPATPEERSMADLLQLEALEVELGVGLVGLIEGLGGGELPGRVTALRKQIATELGLVLPQIHLKDSLTLEPNQYRVLLRGIECGLGSAYADRFMAIDPSGAIPDIPGIAETEPTFGLSVRWVEKGQRAPAERMGYSLVDPSSVITTHLGEILQKNAHELIGRQETQELLNLVARQSPKLVEDVVPTVVTLGELAVVVRNLLQEGVSIRDFRTVVEAVADAAQKSKEPHYLTDAVRQRLARVITARVADNDVVHAIVLTPDTELTLRGALGQTEGDIVLAPDIHIARALLDALRTHAAALAALGRPGVIIAPPDLRRPLFLFASRFVSDLNVISARELAAGTRIERAGEVSLSKAKAA